MKDPAKVFKGALFMSIGTLLFVIIAPEFGLFKMGETELITASYFLVPPIIYGAAGLLSHKKMAAQGKSIYIIPMVASIASVLLLGFFLISIFPSL
mgnify:CR=1 FL=1